MKQLKYNSDMIDRLSDLLFRISNDVRGVGKHASMVQTQLEQVAKSQRELLDEMNNNIEHSRVGEPGPQADAAGGRGPGSSAPS
jgi:hypothetical protein